MAKVVFFEEKCKGCYLCVSACPNQLIKVAENRMNAKGFRPVEVTEQEKCIGWALCATICLDCGIVVFK